MDTTVIAAAIPLFFLLIGIELLATRRNPDRRYAYHDSITNLSCGVGQLVFDAFFGFFAIGGYTLLYERCRLATVPLGSVAGWVGAVLAVDLGYYAFHRASHRINVFWAAHVVHHQSEEYNLSVALRQSWFERPLEWFFYLPIAVAGVPPAMYLTVFTLNTLYQFWIHTRSVGRLGPLEWVLNTPSHHRVHHGSNPKYLDRNYAGIFIVWDRLFGSFQEEEEEPVYGLVKPLASFNPLWANLHYWERMLELARASGSLGEKLTVWARPPEWAPRALGGEAPLPEVTRAAQRKYATRVGRRLDGYVAAHFALVALLTTGFLLVQNELGWARLGLVAVWYVATMVSWGGLFEAKRWAVGLELARLAATPALAGWLALGTRALPVAVGGSALCALASAAFLAGPGRRRARAT